MTVAGLGALLVASFSVPSGISFTAAWIQDPFALYVKRVLLSAAALTALAAWALLVAVLPRSPQAGTHRTQAKAKGIPRLGGA